MKLSIEFDDDGAVYELMDTIVLAHLKSTREDMHKWSSRHADDAEQDKEVIKSLDTLINYFGVSDD